MLCMVYLILQVNQDIIDKHNHELIELKHEYRIHQVHEVGKSFVSSKDMTKYSYKPYLVEKAILGMSSDLIFIWWWPDLKSILENIFAFTN